MTLLENYETEFLKGLKRAFMQWQNRNRIILPEADDDWNLVKFYCSVIRDFLNLDLESIERIFAQKFHSELFGFFIDNYDVDNLIVFIAFVAHLVLEENLSLFLSKIEVTGKFFGNWAVGHVRDAQVGGLIERRIQFSLGREGWSDFYHRIYLNPGHQELDRIIELRQTKQRKTEKENELKKLLVGLVGGSAAAILMTTIAKYTKGLFSIWTAVDHSTQAMFSIGYLPGSIRFYGFCAEKSKPGPSTLSRYKSVYREHLGKELAEIYDRIPIFVKFFLAFIDIEDPTVLSLTSVDNGDKIWCILQRFFWLITQPYSEASNDTDKSCRDFTHKELASLQVQEEGLSDTLITVERSSELDPDLVVLTQKCLEVINREGINVHSANTHVLSELARSLI